MKFKSMAKNGGNNRPVMVTLFPGNRHSEEGNARLQVWCCQKHYPNQELRLKSAQGQGRVGEQRTEKCILLKSQERPTQKGLLSLSAGERKHRYA